MLVCRNVTVNVDRCAEYRALASHELDGELDEFEAVRLHRHLSECEACADWLVGVRRVTALLNEAELERPGQQIEVRALRRRLGRVTAVVATGASATAAGLAAVLLGVPAVGGPGPVTGQRVSAQASPTCAWCSDRLYVLRAIQQAPAPRGPGVTNFLVEVYD